MNQRASDSLQKENPPPSGTLNLWIDCAANPDVFEPGVRQRLGEFQYGGELCVVVSEGQHLAATRCWGAAQPQHLFLVPMVLPRTRRRHLITIGWSKGAMKVLLDSKVIAEMPLTFMLWLGSVSWVLWSHWS